MPSISERARNSIWEILHYPRIRRLTGYPFVGGVAAVLRLGLYRLPPLGYYDESLLYHLVKDVRPDTVIETGTNLGVSTFFILKALDENQRGHLYSIDLPRARYALDEEIHEDYLPAGLAPGFVVPSSLRRRWTLLLGDAKRELPKLLKRLDHVDTFLHDSEHTYDHMMFEFREVWPKMRRGGLLISDDVHLNSSFEDFCRAVDRIPRFSELDRSGKYGWVAC